MAGSPLEAARGVWRLATLAGVVALAWPAAPARAQTELAPIVGPTGSAPPPPWVYAGLPAQKPPATRYAIATIDGARRCASRRIVPTATWCIHCPARRRVCWPGAGASTGRWPPPT